MNDLSQWQKNNDEYLAKSLAWLRLRLARLVQQYGAARPAHGGSASSSAQPESPAESRSSGRRFWGRSTAKDVAATIALLPPAPASINAAAGAEEEVAKAAAELSA